MKLFKTGDILLIFVLILLFFLSFFSHRILSQQGSRVVLFVNDKPVYHFSLNKNLKVTLNGPLGPTEVIIQDGKAMIAHSPCPFHICEKMGKIDKANSSLICVPNRILVRIESNHDRILDGVTQ